ncbi:MAG: hypothetical protein BWX92_03024 [Deltaproteobacteria bacterium ADurb.Bin135]|nr:MAG: hypothetical protein BWX92_03024 [Deltaproteobacteria bacterium ADurb.Bin135]
MRDQIHAHHAPPNGNEDTLLPIQAGEVPLIVTHISFPGLVDVPHGPCGRLDRCIDSLLVDAIPDSPLVRPVVPRSIQRLLH